MFMRRTLIAGLIFLACTNAAMGDDELFGKAPDGPLKLTAPNPLALLEERTLQPEATTPAPVEAALFGTKGTQFGSMSLGLADDFSGAVDLNLRFAWSYFVIRNVEFSAELNTWYFNQPGDDAFGINPAFVFRWHLYNEGRWSIYTDAGIGLLFTTDETPTLGSDVNFTPRIGTGMTYRLDNAGNRLQVGLRWHHISNARIQGDSGNPARDGLMLYAGIMIPF